MRYLAVIFFLVILSGCVALDDFAVEEVWAPDWAVPEPPTSACSAGPMVASSPIVPVSASSSPLSPQQTREPELLQPGH